MTIDNTVEYLIIGIITGIFATFAPVLMAHAFSVIMSIMKNA